MIVYNRAAYDGRSCLTGIADLRTRTVGLTYRPWVRWFSGALIAIALGLGLLAAPSTGQAAEPEERQPSYSFVSTPDLFNTDFADVRHYRYFKEYRRQWRRRFPKHPLPNSWSPEWEAYATTYLDAVAAENGNDVLVAGDLVNGHWHRDRYLHRNGKVVRTHLFGNVRGTFEQRRRVVVRAARFYFSEYRARFAQRGLRLRAGVGDHEFLDNPWSGSTQKFKRAMFGTIRELFHQQFVRPYGYVSRPTGFAARTAYAVRLHPEVLLVTLDQFHRRRDRVRGDIGYGQTVWLDQVLTDANESGVDWILVQGHLPIVPDIRYQASSALCYEGGTSSRLWRLLVKHHVDLYLNGEVHQMSRNTVDGVTQISHGGGSPFLSNWIAADVYGDRMEITLKKYYLASANRTGPRLFEVGGHGPPARVRLEPAPRVEGHLTLTPNQETLDDDGLLEEYVGTQLCGSTGKFR